LPSRKAIASVGIKAGLRKYLSRRAVALLLLPAATLSAIARAA
jgi:hypothetical protein